jgi:hypothetical protein
MKDYYLMQWSKVAGYGAVFAVAFFVANALYSPHGRLMAPVSLKIVLTDPDSPQDQLTTVIGMGLLAGALSAGLVLVRLGLGWVLGRFHSASSETMILDDITLRDLEVFRSAPAIRDVQSAVRFLMEHDIHFSVTSELPDQVDLYLDSAWEVGPESGWGLSTLNALWVALQYGDLLQFAQQGVVSTQRLARQVRDLLERIRQHDPPSVVADLVRGLPALIDELELDDQEIERKPWTVLDADRRLRRRYRSDLHRLIRQLYELDALCSLAEATRIHGLELPEILDDDAFVVEGRGVIHLSLEDPVSNPVTLPQAGTLLFVTGPNMSGKTTYLKSVAVAAYLAHLGMGVPAAAFRITPLDVLYTSLSPEDNVRAGMSYYLAEVRRVRDVAETLVGGKRALVLFDEMFKGTNVRDALEASRLVILGFAESRTAGFVVSSHLIELADDLGRQPSIAFACFPGDVRDGEAEYRFRLQPGISDQRLGLHLLRQEGVPQLLDSLQRKD